jgi:hypothetical protein
MPENRAAGNEKLPVNFGLGYPSCRGTTKTMLECTRGRRCAGDFSLAPPCCLRNNSGVKIKVFLFLAALGLLFTGGCISING